MFPGCEDRPPESECDRYLFQDEAFTVRKFKVHALSKHLGLRDARESSRPVKLTVEDGPRKFSLIKELATKGVDSRDKGCSM